MNTTFRAILGSIFFVTSLAAEEIPRFEAGPELEQGQYVPHPPTGIARLSGSVSEMVALKDKIDSLPTSSDGITCQELIGAKRKLRSQFEAALNEIERRLRLSDPKAGQVDTFQLEDIRVTGENSVCGLVFKYVNSNKSNWIILAEYEFEENELELKTYLQGAR